MISQNKIDDAAYEDSLYCRDWEERTDAFKKGVEFAEKEYKDIIKDLKESKSKVRETSKNLGFKIIEDYQNLAIEFANFISKHQLDFQPSSKKDWIGLNMQYYSSEELFQEFIKNRNNEVKET